MATQHARSAARLMLAPAVILLLGWVGIVKPEVLKRNRKYALLICAVVAAVTTPADVISMLLMLFPLYFLYEFGIVLLTLAPARRVAEGSVIKGAVKDVLGRFDRNDDEDPEGDDDPPAGPDEPTPPFPTDSGGPPSEVIPREGNVPAGEDEDHRPDEPKP